MRPPIHLDLKGPEVIHVSSGLMSPGHGFQLLHGYSINLRSNLQIIFQLLPGALCIEYVFISPRAGD